MLKENKNTTKTEKGSIENTGKREKEQEKEEFWEERQRKKKCCLNRFHAIQYLQTSLRRAST